MNVILHDCFFKVNVFFVQALNIFNLLRSEVSQYDPHVIDVFTIHLARNSNVYIL